MTEDEITRLITPILSGRLAPSGFVHVGVSSGDDHDGIPSLFLDVYFEGKDRPVDSAALVSAMVEVGRLLETRGEARFPYLNPHIPDPDEDLAA